MESTSRRVEEVTNAEATFFGEPILGPILSTAPAAGAVATGGSAGGKIGEVILGIDAGNRQVVQPALSFKRTVITEGDAKDRGHVLRILLEGFLLSKIEFS